MGFFDSLKSAAGSIVEGLGSGIGSIATSWGQQFAANPVATIQAAGMVADAWGAAFGRKERTSGAPAGTVYYPQPYQTQPLYSLPAGPRNTVTVLPGGGNAQYNPGPGPAYSGTLVPSLPSIPSPATSTIPPALLGQMIQQRALPTSPFNLVGWTEGGGGTPPAVSGGPIAMPSFPTTSYTGFQTAGLGDWTGALGGMLGLGSGAAGGTCPAMFRPGMATARPMREVWVPNPVTGQMTLFRPAGRVLLTTGDLASARKVARIARRARRPR